MHTPESAETWVVYNVLISGERGHSGVCVQSAWDAMARVEPSHYQFVQGGIATEAEAERLARASPGGTAARGADRQAL